MVAAVEKTICTVSDGNAIGTCRFKETTEGAYPFLDRVASDMSSSEGVAMIAD